MGKSLEKKQSKLKNIFIIFIAVTLETIIITYPALCAIMGLGVKSAWSDTGFIVSLVFGLVFVCFFGLYFGLVVGLISGLAGGLVFGLVFGLVDGLVRELVFGLVFVYGLVMPLDFLYRKSIESTFAEYSFGILIMGLLFGLIVARVHKPIIGLYAGLGYIIGSHAVTFVGWLLWYAFKRLPEEFLSMVKGLFGSKQELKKHSFLRALSLFLVSYVVVVLIFSLWFYAFYLEGIYFTEGKSNSPFFSVDNINYPQWWDFIYYSFVTITTLGYGDITPLKVFPQILVTFESTIGVMLPAIFIGIIFIGIISHVAGKRGEAKN